MARANVNQAIEFLRQFAGLEVTAAQISDNRDNVLDFDLPADHDLAATAATLTKSLGVPAQEWRDRDGEQYVWDIERDRKRVTLCKASDGLPFIGFVNFEYKIVVLPEL